VLLRTNDISGYIRTPENPSAVGLGAEEAKWLVSSDLSERLKPR